MKTSTKILTTLAVLAAMTTGAWALQRNETRLLMGERLAELGISADEVRRLELAALGKLRHALSEDEFAKLTS